MGSESGGTLQKLKEQVHAIRTELTNKGAEVARKMHSMEAGRNDPQVSPRRNPEHAGVMTQITPTHGRIAQSPVMILPQHPGTVNAMNPNSTPVSYQSGITYNQPPVVDLLDQMQKRQDAEKAEMSALFKEVLSEAKRSGSQQREYFKTYIDKQERDMKDVRNQLERVINHQSRPPTPRHSPVVQHSNQPDFTPQHVLSKPLDEVLAMCPAFRVCIFVVLSAFRISILKSKLLETINNTTAKLRRLRPRTPT